MRRLELIEKCKNGEISGAEYEELCKQFAWLKPNVEAGQLNDIQDVKIKRNRKKLAEE